MTREASENRKKFLRVIVEWRRIVLSCVTRVILSKVKNTARGFKGVKNETMWQNRVKGVLVK